MEFPNFILLDELITTLWVLFLVVLFFIQISSEQKRRTGSDATLVVASDLDRADPDFLFANVPQNGGNVYMS